MIQTRIVFAFSGRDDYIVIIHNVADMREKLKRQKSFPTYMGHNFEWRAHPRAAWSNIGTEALVKLLEREAQAARA